MCGKAEAIRRTVVLITLLIRMTVVPIQCSFSVFWEWAGAQLDGDLGEILALGAEISPYIGLREKWESP